MWVFFQVPVCQLPQIDMEKNAALGSCPPCNSSSVNRSRMSLFHWAVSHVQLNIEHSNSRRIGEVEGVIQLQSMAVSS